MIGFALHHIHRPRICTHLTELQDGEPELVDLRAHVLVRLQQHAVDGADGWPGGARDGPLAGVIVAQDADPQVLCKGEGREVQMTRSEGEGRRRRRKSRMTSAGGKDARMDGCKLWTECSRRRRPQQTGRRKQAHCWRKQPA